MRKMLVFVMMLALVGSAMAFELGSEQPAKKPGTYPASQPHPTLQGGDTILNATPVVIPVVDGSGTTVGYTDDYDEVCPFTGSTSPDVVYTFTPDMNMILDIDMCGSAYDTKIYVYDGDLNLVACNDDFYGFGDPCGSWVSRFEQLPVMGGTQYYLVIDGYGGASGAYTINITEFIPDPPCVLECPAGAEIEGEPELVDGYTDNYNGGCNTPGTEPFQPITGQIFCGKSGWYMSADGLNSRDTDWFEIVVPATGFVEIIGDAEQESFMFELGPQDCGSVGVIQNVIIGPCAEGTITIPGAAGSTIWFWVGPTEFTPPVGFEGNEYDYVLLTNLEGVAVEAASFTDVKALFN